MIFPNSQSDAAARRWKERERHRSRNERYIKEGRFLEIDDPAVVEKFLTRRGYSPKDAATCLRHRGRGLPAAVLPVDGIVALGSLERILGTNDMVGVSFFERGLQVARTVGRIWMDVAAGRPAGFGTGFLISPRLLMTNHHVLGDRAVARRSLVELDYEIGVDGRPRPTTSFAFDPDVFHFADAELDYAVVAVQRVATDGRSLSDYGWNRLYEEEGKAIISQWVNIIQHPNGEPKQLGLRENQVIDRLENFLHYKTDTAPGSSGSPVYNDLWEVVALHHSGVYKKNLAGDILTIDDQIWRPEMGEHRIQWIANEGARVSRIVAHLRRQTMNADQRLLLDEMLSAAPPEVNRSVGSADAATPSRGGSAAVRVADDGTATWTIPLQVSVKLGGVPVAASAAPTTAVSPATTLAASAATLSGGPESLLAAAKAELGGRADVLDVRLGYVFRDGWITKDRAVVVTVQGKKPPRALREAGVEALPETFRGLPVEVTNPTLESLIRLARGAAVSEAAFREPSVLREEITYHPPANAGLDPVTAIMRVVAHLSPDAGWTQLKGFLSAVQNRLVVGMYDFGAPHIVQELEAVAQRHNFDRLSLVMQHGESVGSGTKEDDLKDDAVVERLQQAFGNRFENAWVKTGRVNGWISSSYHIKVAVRDQKALWLSSGNWQSSNQPAADPVNEHPQVRKWLSNYNREWHAIVEHAGLAKTFETYLLHDFTANRDFNPGEELALPDLLVPASFFVPTPQEAGANFKYFAPFDATRQFSLRPLLTPDNYHEHVLRLVQEAQRELFIQNQTFNAPGENHEKLRELVDAVLARQQAGVDVRIIFRVLFAPKARETLEALQDLGFDMNSFRLQKNCHTKGIIVDREKVLLGSQNWSNDGVSVNRDASLLFDDAELAGYFAGAFDHDWKVLAKQSIGNESLPIEAASTADPTAEGMVRLTWKDYMEMF